MEACTTTLPVYGFSRTLSAAFFHHADLCYAGLQEIEVLSEEVLPWGGVVGCQCYVPPILIGWIVRRRIT